MTQSPAGGSVNRPYLRSPRLSRVELIGVPFPQKEKIKHPEPKQPDGEIEGDPRGKRDPGIEDGEVMSGWS